jgi:predicted RNase H-like nuclease
MISVQGTKGSEVIAGVDGCRGGWIAAISDGGKYELRLFSNFASVWGELSTADLILVDVPIGLRDEGNSERLCDVEARKKLGRGRASSVFPAPCRAALIANSYVEACRINEERTNRSMTQQTFAILGKIRELDDLFSVHPEAIEQIREVHPEVCFWSFAGKAMCFKKSKAAGYVERLKVLAAIYPGAEAVIASSPYRRADVARDDLIDAVVAMLTAEGDPSQFKTLPASPETDSRGLRMEIVYRVPTHTA